MRFLGVGILFALLGPIVAQGCAATPKECAKSSDCAGGEECLYRMGDCSAHGECHVMSETSGGCGGQQACSGCAYTVCGCRGEPVGVQCCYPSGYASGPTASTSPSDSCLLEDAGMDASSDASFDVSIVPGDTAADSGLDVVEAGGE